MIKKMGRKQLYKDEKNFRLFSLKTHFFYILQKLHTTFEMDNI